MNLLKLKSFLHDWVLLKKRSSIIVLIAVILYIYFSFYFSYIINYKSEQMKDELRDTAIRIVGNASTDEEKVFWLTKWENENIKNIYGSCGLFSNDILCIVYPLSLNPLQIRLPSLCIRTLNRQSAGWIMFDKCGSCDEFSVLYRELANAVNITSRSIHNDGEDHSWDEVFINGSWKIVDVTMDTYVFDRNPSYYELNRTNMNGSQMDVSYVYAMYPNGTTEDITSKYTRTGKLIVKVNDNNLPLEDITVLIYSNSYRSDAFTNASCITNSSGVCVFNLGGTSYTIVALKDGIIKYSDDKKILLKENDTEEIVLNPNKIDILRTIPSYIQLIPIVIIFWLLAGIFVWEVTELHKIRQHKNNNTNIQSYSSPGNTLI